MLIKKKVTSILKKYLPKDNMFRFLSKQKRHHIEDVEKTLKDVEEHKITKHDLLTKIYDIPLKNNNDLLARIISEIKNQVESNDENDSCGPGIN